VLVLILISSAGVICWPALLLRARRIAPVRLRPVVSWLSTGTFLFLCDGLVSTLAIQLHWTLHHSAVGVAAFLLPVGTLACLGIGAVTGWRRRFRQPRA
jgi:hypothetical protein